MYLKYYQLNENPFTLVPDPRFLFFGNSHKEVFSQLLYGVTQGHGFMMMNGELGTGKTLLINSLLDNLSAEFHIAVVNNTVLDLKGLLRLIARELELKTESQTIDDIILDIQDELKKKSDNGQKTILIVDEAQNLKPNVFDTLRFIAEFNVKGQRFLQIIFAGHPSLENLYNLESMRPLKDRTTVWARLSSLESVDEIKGYIDNRLKIAGCPPEVRLFDIEAVEAIWIYSSGIPRTINRLCDQALLLGYAEDLKTINFTTIETVATTMLNSAPITNKIEQPS